MYLLSRFDFMWCTFTSRWSCSLKFQVLQWELKPVYSCSCVCLGFFLFLFFFLLLLFMSERVPFLKDSFKRSLLLTVLYSPLLWLKLFILLSSSREEKVGILATPKLRYPELALLGKPAQGTVENQWNLLWDEGSKFGTVIFCLVVLGCRFL